MIVSQYDSIILCMTFAVNKVVMVHCSCHTDDTAWTGGPVQDGGPSAPVGGSGRCGVCSLYDYARDRSVRVSRSDVTRQ